jgi:hypothetical protein
MVLLGRFGIIDGLLCCVAKSLQVRVRVRRNGKEGAGPKVSKPALVAMDCLEAISEPAKVVAGTVHPESSNARYKLETTICAFLRGRSNTETARAVVQLLKTLSLVSWLRAFGLYNVWNFFLNVIVFSEGAVFDSLDGGCEGSSG